MSVSPWERATTYVGLQVAKQAGAAPQDMTMDQFLGIAAQFPGTGENFKFPTGDPNKPEASLRDPISTDPGSQWGTATWADFPEWLKARDPEAHAELEQRMKDAGYTSWVDVLKGASYSQKPWEEFLAWRIDAVDQYGLNTGEASSNSRTSTTLSSQSDAAGTLDQAMQSELGRRATATEVSGFTTALNAQQRANPQTSRTSTTGGTDSTTTETYTTGFDPARFAIEWAQSQPEYAEVQAATTFMDILDRAISNPDALSRMITGGQ